MELYTIEIEFSNGEYDMVEFKAKDGKEAFKVAYEMINNIRCQSRYEVQDWWFKD